MPSRKGCLLEAPVAGRQMAEWACTQLRRLLVQQYKNLLLAPGLRCNAGFGSCCVRGGLAHCLHAAAMQGQHVVPYAGVDHCPTDLVQNVLTHLFELGGVFEDFIRRMFAMRFATRWTCERTGESGLSQLPGEVLWVMLDGSPSAMCEVRAMHQMWQVSDMGGCTARTSGPWPLSMRARYCLPCCSAGMLAESHARTASVVEGVCPVQNLTRT